MDNKGKYINDFLNPFFNFFHERQSLLLDNIDIFCEMSQFVEKQASLNTSKTEFDWNKISKSTFLKNIELIDNFFKKLGIDFSADNIVRDGTIDIIITNKEKIMSGLCSYQGNHIDVKIYNNGYITDAIVWTHEISHYRNLMPNEIKSQENYLLTEVLAHTMSLVFTDYLEDEGFIYEANSFRCYILNVFKRASSMAYTISKFFKLYESLGEISRETYRNLYGSDEHFEEEKNKFVRIIIKDRQLIFSALWYTLSGFLSIYMYEQYRKDNNYINKIEELNTSLLNGDNLSKCLKIIGITGYNDESLDKIKESFTNYKNRLKVLKK